MNACYLYFSVGETSETKAILCHCIGTYLYYSKLSCLFAAAVEYKRSLCVLYRDKKGHGKWREKSFINKKNICFFIIFSLNFTDYYCIINKNEVVIYVRRCHYERKTYPYFKSQYFIVCHYVHWFHLPDDPEHQPGNPCHSPGRSCTCSAHGMDLPENQN